MNIKLTNITVHSDNINSEKFLNNLKNSDLSNKGKIEKAAKGFETMFVYRLLKEMRKTVPENPFFSSGLETDIFLDMMDYEIAQKSSERSGLGIAELLIREFSSDNKEMMKVINENKNKIEKTYLNKGIKKNMVPENYYNETILGRVNKYSNIINYYSQKYNVNSNLIKAVISQESQGEVDALSKRGAKGLMQLVDETAKEMDVQNINDPVENIKGGTKYLRKMLDLFNGNVELALAAYNSGPGNVRKYGEVPPFKQTQEFVKNVLKYKDMIDKNVAF